MVVDFFFGPGSRYSYLAATQLQRIADQTGATFRWRALFSGDLIERAGGASNSPQDPKYRDLDARRWARHYKVPYQMPLGPCDWRKLARACVAAAQMNSAESFALGLYGMTYGEGRVPDDQQLAGLAETCNLDAAAFLAAIDSASVHEAHERNITDALRSGAFGVPTFLTASGAMVWGQDRLTLLRDIVRLGEV